jgi:hypothetical protein
MFQTRPGHKLKTLFENFLQQKGLGAWLNGKLQNSQRKGKRKLLLSL